MEGPCIRGSAIAAGFGIRARAALVVVALVLLGSPAAVTGQDVDADSLRAAFRLPVPPRTLPLPVDVLRPTPAMGANSPTGWGASWGDLFAGVSYQTRARNVDGHDGAVAAGFGLGNPARLVGLEVAVISFSTVSGGFGTRMGVDFKLHRLMPGRFGVAVGWESAIVRGRTDGLSSRYIAASRWFQLKDDPRSPFSALVLSGGLGNERFLPIDDLVAGTGGVGFFGSAALRVLEPVSVIADWTGQDLALGASVAPLRRHALVISGGWVDLTGSAGDGARLVLSVGYGMRFRDEP